MNKLIAFLITITVSLTATGQKKDKYMIYGHLADMETKAPLFNAWMYLYDSNHVFIDSTKVDREIMNYKPAGFMFRNIFPRGTYFIKVSLAGYCSPTVQIELTKNEDQPTLFLKKLPPAGETVEKEYEWELTKIEVLKESPAYAPDKNRTEAFRYANRNNSQLKQTRKEFNLDSIAGKGNDVSRIKNLLYWVHNNIRHSGSNRMPEGPMTLSNIYNSAKVNNCGYNCRALAICLTEALLAEGIPARYITCQSKEWDTDGDCHVICVAWSRSLKKWIWVDPTFASYISDENGVLLHPGEVRYRLQHGLPLELNEDANWNNESPQEKMYYLDEYMAKNLYIFSANMFNQCEPEGKSQHQQGAVAALVPQGSNFNQAYIITTDEEWFWQPPVKKFRRNQGTVKK